jgi:hypothetical protein
MARPTKPDHLKKPRKTHSFRLADGLIETMRQLSEFHDRSLSGEITVALKEYAAKHGKPWTGHEPCDDKT